MEDADDACEPTPSGVTWTRLRAGRARSPAGLRPGRPGLLAGAAPGALWPTMSDTTATAAPAPATANPIVETVASELPALRSEMPVDVVHVIVRPLALGLDRRRLRQGHQPRDRARRRGPRRPPRSRPTSARRGCARRCAPPRRPGRAADCRPSGRTLRRPHEHERNVLLLALGDVDFCPSPGRSRPGRSRRGVPGRPCGARPRRPRAARRRRPRWPASLPRPRRSR